MDTCTAISKVILLISLGVSIVSSQGGTDPFRGAVVEYGARFVNTSSKDTVLENLKNYANIAEELTRKYTDLKIIVFPEGGLASIEWLQRDKSEIYGESYPEKNPDVLYCEDSYNTSQILKALACIGKNRKVYVVVNLVEKVKKNNTDVLYNTNIVLSPKGALVAKYHKYNTYGFEKKSFDKPEKPETEFFDTDFGVRFGLFTSFDILFKSPALDLAYGNNSITHFAFTSAWKNELPFMTAVQEQSSWSYATNKVLLASGLNNPAQGSSGSGIYFGKLGNDNTIDKRSVQNQIRGDFAIVSYIPKSLTVLTSFSSRSEICNFYNTSNPERTPLKIVKDNLEVYKTDVIDDSGIFEAAPRSRNLTIFSTTQVNRTVCDRGLCCKFVFSIKRYYSLDIMMPSTNEVVGEEFGQYNYRLAVFNGVKNFDGTQEGTGGIQVCSIISCLDSNEGSCGKKTVDATPNSIQIGQYKFRHSYTEFDNVIISAELTTDNSFVSSNILLSSQHYLFSLDVDQNVYDYIKFGKIADPSLYTITQDGEVNKTTPTVFKSTYTIRDPASINLYNRLFSLDGQEETKTDKNSGSNFYLSTNLLLLSLLILFIRK